MTIRYNDAYDQSTVVRSKKYLQILYDITTVNESPNRKIMKGNTNGKFLFVTIRYNDAWRDSTRYLTTNCTELYGCCSKQ